MQWKGQKWNLVWQWQKLPWGITAPVQPRGMSLSLSLSLFLSLSLSLSLPSAGRVLTWWAAAPAGGTHFWCVLTNSLSLSHQCQVPGACTPPQKENAGRTAAMPGWVGVTGYTPVLMRGVNIIACVHMWYGDFGTSCRRMFRMFVLLLLLSLLALSSLFVISFENV